MKGWGRGMRAAYQALKAAVAREGGPVTDSEWRDVAREMSGGKLPQDFPRAIDRLAAKSAFRITEDRKYATWKLEDLI